MQQQVDRVTAVAQRAAELLPPPPREGDVEGYLAWRELVWATAMRIGALGEPGAPAPARPVDLQVGCPVSAANLLDLARQTSIDATGTDHAAGAWPRPPGSEHHVVRGCRGVSRRAATRRG